MSQHRSLTLFILGAFVLGLGLSAGASAARPVRAQEDPVHIVASFSILADVAANVAGDAAEIESLMPLGSNPHAYQPSAQDVATLSDADAVLVVGVNFEEGLLPVVQEAAGDKLVVASECVPIRPVHASTTHEDDIDHEHGAVGARCEAQYETVMDAFGLDEHALLDGALGSLNTLECAGHDEHEEDADHDESEEEHEHEAGSCNPHVWTDPVNVGLWALTVRDTLIELDPANESVYTANADVYLAKLAAAADEAQSLIDAIPPERRYIVTNHLAFNYFTERYGLTLVGAVIPSASNTSEPSVQDVLDLIETVQEYGVPAIFTETIVSEDLAQQIANETGATIARLYTGSLSDPDGPAATYIDYLLYNARQMSEALQ